MAGKPTYEELERKVRELDNKAAEHTRTEEQLAATKSRLEYLVTASPAVIYSFVLEDAGYNVTFMSENVKALTGYEARHFLESPDFWTSRLHPDDAPQMTPAVDHLFDKGYYSCEYRFQHRDGRYRWMHDELRLVRYKPEGPLEFVGYWVDVTDRKEADAALRENQRVFSTLLSNVPGMAYSCRNDPDWTAEFLGDGCRALTGYDSEDFVTKRLSYGQIIHPEDRDYVWDKVQSALSENTPFEIVYRIKTLTNREKWVWEKGRGIFDSTGRLLCLEGFITDITEHKRAEEALREQTSRNQLILQTTMEGFLLVDARGEILEVNEAASAICGYSEQEMLAKSLHAIESPATAGETAEHIRRVTENQSDSFETAISHKSGHTVDVEISTNCIRLGGQRFFFSFFRDISRRKQAERELSARESELRAETENLEQANTALNVLLKKIDRDKSEIEERVGLNVKLRVVPHLEKLKKSRLDRGQAACLHALESSLREIVSPFSRSLSSHCLRLTPAEIHTANLLRDGLTTKEMAQVMNLSSRTIESHRASIRRKMGLKDKKANLRSHLLSLG